VLLRVGMHGDALKEDSEVDEDERDGEDGDASVRDGMRFHNTSCWCNFKLVHACESLRCAMCIKQ